VVCSFRLQEMQDGQGFFYGELKVGHVQRRLNLLPPRSYAHPWFVLGPREPHA
jgi:hypothetical protein